MLTSYNNINKELQSYQKEFYSSSKIITDEELGAAVFNADINLKLKTDPKFNQELVKSMEKLHILTK
ncbi:MAG: hypothetical protein HQL12_09020 [Candidatus Omnitrophica bacterium]|nr:hypothetical protein [Candidatus Omnitrophota bacterium]